MLDLTNIESVEVRAVVEYAEYSDDGKNYGIFNSTEEAREFIFFSLGEDFYYQLSWVVYAREPGGFMSQIVDCDSQEVAETIAVGLRLLLAEQKKK